MNSSQNSTSVFQGLSTLLAALLPLLQILLGFIPQHSLTLILFRDHLLLVSLVAAIFSYMLIIAFKNTTYFEFTFWWRQHKKYKKFQHKTNQLVFSQPEILNTVKNDWVDRPPYITPLNVYYLLLPLDIILFLSFLALGFFYANTQEPTLAFAQATIYVFLIALTSLTLGVFYINEINRNKREAIEQEKWERVRQLLYSSQAIPEIPQLEFVAHPPSSYDVLETILRVADDRYYIVSTDRNATKMQEISPYDPNTRQRLEW